MNLGTVIQAYMRAHGIDTHSQMAKILGIDRTLVSKYVSGARRCHDVPQLRRLAEAMDLPPETFGLLPEPVRLDGATGAETDEVSEWRLIRQTLNRHRSELTSVAAGLYWDSVRVEGTSCISRPDWLPEVPLPLDAIDLAWEPDVPQPILNGGEPESALYRPVSPAGARYSRYSQAIRAIAAPALFENRGSYRLLSLDLAAPSAHMAFGYTTYFDMVDVCEVLAHETAGAWLRRTGVDGQLSMGELPFRAHVGDLFDLARRPVLPSINTLTIRRAREGDSFFLHRRGTSKVTIAAGQSHVVPAGVFQPSGIAPWNMAGDFDPWRNILREYSEELLGAPEHDGSSGAPIDYDGSEPFRALNHGRREGKVRPWFLGMGFDPLAPAGEILTTVVIDADVFDSAFAGMVATNAEGDMFPSDRGSVGIAWNAPNIHKSLKEEPLACAAAACIALTWKHRRQVLAD
ncbi:MAG: helix-turn-helix domain-containing protein [Actinopolymorphaceae bacterium]